MNQIPEHGRGCLTLHVHGSVAVRASRGGALAGAWANRGHLFAVAGDDLELDDGSGIDGTAVGCRVRKDPCHLILRLTFLSDATHPGLQGLLADNEIVLAVTVSIQWAPGTEVNRNSHVLAALTTLCDRDVFVRVIDTFDPLVVVRSGLLLGVTSGTLIVARRNRGRGLT